MGGELRVTSQPAVGSTFWLALPLPAAETDDVVAVGASDSVPPVVEAPAARASLVAPPPALLAKARELTAMGDMHATRAWVAELARGDARYGEFATRILELATKFKVRAIEELLEGAALYRSDSEEGPGS